MRELYIDKLSGNEFEEYLVNVFEGLGYDVILTPASNDYGADLVISKGKEKIVVQAKRYSNTVGISSIQEVIGAKNYYQATKCLVVTNNYYTPNAIELAKVNDVELWDRDKLIEMAILSINPSFAINSFNDTTELEKDHFSNIDNTDELLPEAIRLTVSWQIASISMLQRHLNIGYDRAAKLIDQMEIKGIISGYNGDEPRKVLISSEDLIEFNAPDLNMDMSLGKSYIKNKSEFHKVHYLNPFVFNYRRFIKNSLVKLILFPLILYYYLIKICIFLSINILIFIINTVIYFSTKKTERY